MRTLLKNCLLACVGTLLLAGVSSADVVLTSVDQLVSVKVGSDENQSTNTTAPISPLTIDLSTANGVAQASQGTSFSLISPASFVVTTAASARKDAGDIFDIVSGNSEYLISFSLDGPYAYELTFTEVAATGLQAPEFVLSGPGINQTAEGTWSGQLEAGTYSLGVKSTAATLSVGSPASVSGSASLTLTAVPEPSAFAFLGLACMGAVSGRWVLRRYF